MVETRSSKCRRLMSISSNVSRQRPDDLPATFESLNDDTKRLILQFVGNKSYVTYAGINKHCKEIYLATKGMTKETFLFGYAPLSAIINKIERAIEVDVYNLESQEAVGKGVVLYNRRDIFEWALQERNSDVLRGIFNIAGREGRIDILVEVLNNIDDEDNKEYIFDEVDQYAALHGKLDVLKWHETKGLSIDKDSCAERAAEGGQLHIIQWLREEKGLEIDGLLYEYAIDGNQLHVMKYLKEEDCPWYEYTFQYAAIEGNLAILQWLHDEGCPWPDDRYHVLEGILKPEVVQWLRTNGYGDRIVSRR